MSADEDNLTYTQGVIDVIKDHLKANSTDHSQSSMTLDEIIGSVRQQVAKDDETMSNPLSSPLSSPFGPKQNATSEPKQQTPVAPAILANALVTRGNSYEYRVSNDMDSLDTGQHTYHVNELLRFYDEPFVTHVYHAMLKRAPDEGGMFHYLKELRSGRLTRIEIIAGMFLSAEGKLAKVKIKGLWLPFLSARLYKLPVIGYFLHIASGIANLPRIMRALTNVESHQFVAQQQDRKDLRHLSEQVSESFAKVDSNLKLAANAVDEQNGAQQQTKAELSQLQSISINEQQLLQQVKQQVQQHLADKADKRWTKEQLAGKADHSWSESQFAELQRSKVSTEQFEQKADRQWVEAHLSEQLADLQLNELQLAKQLAEKADNQWVEQQLNEQLAEKADSQWVEQQLNEQLAEKADSQWVEQHVSDELAEKADQQWVDDKLDGKTSFDWVKLQLAEKADGHWLKSQLANKADSQQVNEQLAQKAGLQWTSERFAEKAGLQWTSERLADKAGIQWANEKLTEKASSQWVDAQLLEKASIESVNAQLLEKASSESVNAQMLEKASYEWVNAQVLEKAS